MTYIELIRRLRLSHIAMAFAGAMILLVAVACGDAMSSTPQASQAKQKIVFADLSWSSALIQNDVARYIIEHGYEYPTDSIFGGTLPRTIQATFY